MKAKVFGIISVKGGVGKTTSTSNLGLILSKVFNKKVCIVDANFSAPNLGLHFGIINPKFSIQDVLSNKADIKNVIHQFENMDLILSNPKNSSINPQKFKSKINSLRNKYDVILIDSSPSLNNEMLSTIIASDELIVMSSPDYPTLYSTLHAIKVAGSKNMPILGLVLNNVYHEKFELSINDIENISGINVISKIPHTKLIPKSISESNPVTNIFPNSDVAVEYAKLASVMIKEDYKDNRLISKVKRLLSNNDPLDKTREIIRTRL